MEIGLLISLGIVIIAFAANQKAEVKKIDLGGIADEVETIDVTVQEEQKPQTAVKQTVQVITDLLNVVKNDTKITTDFDFVDFDEGEINVSAIAVEEESIEEDAPFLFAEEMPKFEGGDLNTFRKWVIDRFRYPTIAQENGIQGRVVLQFVIEKDGRLTNIQVLQTPDRTLSDEAVRVLGLSPKWTPGKQRNVPVRVKYTLPVEFKITQ